MPSIGVGKTQNPLQFRTENDKIINSTEKAKKKSYDHRRRVKVCSEKTFFTE